MAETVTEAAFVAWVAQQPLAFELVDGRPARLPDECQGPSRLARVRLLARKVMADEAAVTAWMGAPHVELGGLEPETLALDGEEGCQLVLQALVRLGRQREAAGV
jgi:uncharacterized protein (DUF2384 family)